MKTIEYPAKADRPPRSVAVARAVLWAQVIVLLLCWLAPEVVVVGLLVTEGVPDDGSAPWLLIPVIYTSPLLVYVVIGFGLALRLSRGTSGRGGRVGLVVWEATLMVVAGVALAMAGPRLMSGMFVVPLPMMVLMVLAASYVLIVLGRRRPALSPEPAA
jgi:hypothetical protein